ncbi:MAG: Crp/Fnr family transcriptional regulator [Clostridia bacterium]|nr:Crp/Fnr family transcriptional regulator [Clostridia bacterium]
MNERDVLRQSPLFRGMTDEEISFELRLYQAHRRAYAKGDSLLRVGDPVKRFAIVLSGGVQVMSDDIDGHHMIMATVQPGQTFAESLCFRMADESPVYAEAIMNTEVYWLSADALREGPAARFLSMLTAKTLSMNERIRVLSKLTLRDKLMTLFMLYMRQQGPVFDLPFDRESLAAYLGVNRSALSREMSRMREEGLIDYRKNHIEVRRKP